MSIFTKPSSQLSTADLQQLLDDASVENVRLEFKSEAPSKDETLKKLSSFANTFGGYMVVGAKAQSADGRIESFPGVDLQPGYKQKIVDWCFTSVTPPIAVEISDPIASPAGNGKVCYVAHIGESDLAPHFLNGRKGIWVRTDEFSSRYEPRLANENELEHLLDRRRVVRERRTALVERARTRFKRYIAKRHPETLISHPASMTHAAVQAEGEHGSSACLNLSVLPRFPVRQAVQQAKLDLLIHGNTVSWQGSQFPATHNTLVSQHESMLVLPEDGEPLMFEANVWGMLFYGIQIQDSLPRQGGRTPSGIYLPQLIGSVLLFAKHADRMLQGYGCTGPILLEAQLTSLLGVPWLYDHLGVIPMPKTGSVVDDGATFAVETTVEEFHEDTDRTSLELLRNIAFSANWPDLFKPEDSRAHLNLGYKFNMWPERRP